MRTAVILAAGEGTKVWPYAEVRPKAMIPVAGKPIAAHQVELLSGLGFARVVLVGGKRGELLENELGRPGRAPAGIELVFVREPASASGGSGAVRGTARSLLAAAGELGDEPFVVLYGDTLLEADDVRRLVERFESPAGGSVGAAAALVAPLGSGESPQDWICCSLREADDGGGAFVDRIMGHPRDGVTHRFCAFAFGPSMLRYCRLNSGLFTNVQVGMMPPPEAFLEMSLADWLTDGHRLPAVVAEGAFFDIDKPWHILEANDWLVRKLCGAMSGSELDIGASIDPSAVVNGRVRLGAGSRIGRNVLIEGNVIVGRNTVIENGAILQGNHVIGDDVYIGNYCFLSEGATVGSRCVVNHCAELDGLIMDNVYLYHYMEFYGIIGTSADLGAATVCGTLRFDDGRTPHRVKGRREVPREHANAVYLGDYVRTGVNAILMPGVKVGVYSVVGPGVLLQDDVPNGKIVSLRQQLETRDWGPHRYGW